LKRLKIKKYYQVLHSYKSKKIKIFNEAVSVEDGYKKFYDSGDTSSSLIDRERTKNIITVKTINLSKYILENFDKKDFIIIKLDIEGSEYDVIDHFIKNGIFSYIDIFFAEIHGSKTGKSLSDSINLINKVSSCGHKIYEWEAVDFKYDNFKKNYYTIDKIKLYHAKWDKKIFQKKSLI
jgi:FkbM family methyltransferase